MSKSLNLSITLKAADKASGVFGNIKAATDNLTGGVTVAQKKLGNLKAVEQNIAGYRKLGAQYRDSSSALGEARAKLSALQEETKSMGKITVAHRKKIEKASIQVRKLTGKQDVFLQKMKQSSQYLKNQSIDVKKLGQHEQSLTQKIDKASRALDRQADKMRKVEKRAESFARANKKLRDTMSFAANMSFAGGAGLLTGKAAARGLFNMISPGIALEDQLAELSGVSGVAKDKEQAKALKALVMDLGGSTSFTGQEVAEGMTQLARTGFDANKILATTGDVLNLARATNTDLGETAKISSDIMSAMDIPASQMQRVSDALAFTDNRSNNTLLELGESMKYVAPIAKTVGMDLESTLGVLAKLGDAGLKGSMAGTSFRRVLGNLAANDTAIDTIKKLGISATDAEGNMRPMIDILKEVQEQTAYMGNADQLEIMKDIAGQNAFTAFTVMTQQQDAILRKQKEIREALGYSADTAKNRDDTTGGDIRLLNSAFETLRTTIHDLNSGEFRALIQNITKTVVKATEWVKMNPELTGQILKASAALAGLVVIGGGVLLFISAILAPIRLVAMAFKFALLGAWGFGKALVILSGKAVLGIIGLFGKVTKAIWGVNIAMTANPIGLFVAGVAGLVAAGAALYIWWDDIKELANSFFDMLYEHVPFLEEFIGIVKILTGGLGNAFSGVSSLASYIFGGDDDTQFATAGVSSAGSNIIYDSPIASSRPISRANINDNSQINMTLNVHGGDPEEVRRVVQTELHAHQRQVELRRRSAFGTG